MAGGVFVGRTRPLWKVALYQLLTLGVYGRVHLYKSAKDIDGHEALFLDLRLWLLGVILPVGGPLVVKWRLLHHLEPLVRHDATAPKLHVVWLRAAAFLPLLPVYHVLVQRHLTHHWVLHRKLADLEARREVLEEHRALARTEADREEIGRLEEDLRMRSEALNQAQEAALEIREARRARARAEDEIRAAGGAPSPLQRIKRLAPLDKLKLKRRPSGSPEPEPEPAPEPPAPTPRKEREAATKPPARPEPHPAPVETGLPDVGDPELSRAERKALAKHLAARTKREEGDRRAHAKRMEKARKAAEKAGQPAPEPEPVPASEPRRKEKKWLKRFERARERRQRKEGKALERKTRRDAREAAKAETPTEPPARSRFGFLRRKPKDEPAPEPAAPAPEAAPVPPEPMPEAPDEALAPKTRARSKSRSKAKK